MAEFQPRKPDYNVSALCKRTEVKGNIGVAWKQPNGSIQVKLNAFLVLDTARNDLVISLFPNDGVDRRKVANKQDEQLTDNGLDTNGVPPF